MDELERQAERTYRAIGRFMFEFSQTEFTIRKGLEGLLALDPRFFDPVIQSYDVILLCNVTKKVADAARPAGTAEIIGSLISRFIAINTERLRVAHGLWVPYFRGGMVVHVTRNKLASAMHTEQTDMLEAKSDELASLRSHLAAAFTGLQEK